MNTEELLKQAGPRGWVQEPYEWDEGKSIAITNKEGVIALISPEHDKREVDEMDRAHAELIVRAVNSFEAMRYALGLAMATMERLKPSKPYDSYQGTRDVINAALALADGIESEVAK